MGHPHPQDSSPPVSHPPRRAPCSSQLSAKLRHRCHHHDSFWNMSAGTEAMLCPLSPQLPMVVQQNPVPQGWNCYEILREKFNPKLQAPEGGESWRPLLGLSPSPSLAIWSEIVTGLWKTRQASLWGTRDSTVLSGRDCGVPLKYPVS